MNTRESNKRKRSTFAVSFYLNREKQRKDGTCPVLCRVSVDATSVRLSVGVQVSPSLWDANAGRAIGRSTEAVAANKAIEGMQVQIAEHYTRLMAAQGYATAEMIRNAVKGIAQKPAGLLALFREHNEEFRQRIGVDRNKEAWESYGRTCRMVEFFIKAIEESVEGDLYYRHRKHCSEGDIPLIFLDKTFIEDFELFLRSVRKQAPKTVSVHTIYLKKIGRRAVRQGTLTCDPFALFRADQPVMQCRHHQADELERIMQAQVEDDELRYIRDMFVFSCFTGISYADVTTLREEHIVKTADGGVWIDKRRKKTGSIFKVKLMPIPQAILNKYGRRSGDECIFTLPTRQEMPKYMRALEKATGVSRITYHMARHNFATQIALSNGVPMITLSKMMGHTSISTTQIYAKITNQKVDSEMKTAKGRINKKYSLPENVYAADAGGM